MFIGLCPGRLVERHRECMRRFERRDDSLRPGQRTERGQGARIGTGGVGGAATLLEPGVLGADAGIVESRRNRMALADLPLVVLERDAEGAVENAGPAGVEGRAMAAGLEALAGRLHPEQPDRGVVEERGEDAHRVRAAAHRCDHDIGQLAGGEEDLLPGLVADDALKVAHHGGEGMRARHGPQQVVGVLVAGGPVAERLVDRVLERLRAGGDRHHLRAHEAHAEDVLFLPLHVHRAHVHAGLHAEHRAGERGGDAVLACAGLGDETALAHLPREQPLAQRLIGLVGPAVEEVFPLEVDLRRALCRQIPAPIERRRPAGVVDQQVVELALEPRDRAGNRGNAASSCSSAGIRISGT